MFQKLKQFKQLRQTAKTLQRELAGEQISVERDGIRLVLDGNLDVTSLVLPQNFTAEELQRRLPDVVNQAIDKAQKVAAEKIRQHGGLEGLGLGKSQ